MALKKFYSIILIINLIPLLLMSSQAKAQQTSLSNSTRPWKGNAILGNGNICLVYSDDSRIVSESKARGIQHFYFKDYTADYIASSAFELVDKQNSSFRSAAAGKADNAIGIENAFCAFTKIMLPGGVTKNVRCYVHPKDAAVLSLTLSGLNQASSYQFRLTLRNSIITDRKTSLTTLKKERNAAFATWSNNTILVIAPKSSKDILEITDSLIMIYGKTPAKGNSEVLVIAAPDKEEALKRLQDLRAEKDLFAASSAYWNKWFQSGILPELKGKTQEDVRYLDYYKRTLYALRAATLNGMIPADITGQFVTNNMPQLYPRDAMMCARVLLMTGHAEEAKDVIKFWTRPEIPKKSDGEFYARYDARTKAVDAGSGARFDEPEWDANGYFIQLVNDYYLQKNEWLADKAFIYELADFLVKHIDKSGLLYEGGIVEWTGYLPSTNMTCSAALKTASRIASSFGDKDKSLEYLKASETIAGSIKRTFDTERQALCALRFHGVKAEGNVSITDPAKDTLYLWDTSLNFGVLWGFPDNAEIKATNNFIEENNVKSGGGVQYFEAKDNAWLSGYGGDLFFFTTGAAAQYQSLYGDNQKAKEHIDWMISNSNSYGLMPERIYLNQSDCSPASPLSWCNAEFAASVLTWSRK